MTNQIKYYSLNSLPTSAEIGAIYFLSNGSQYIGTSSNTFLPISDFIFVDEMPVLGIMDKIYVHKEADKTSLKIWSGTGFEVLSGEEFDDSATQEAITLLQNELSTLQGKVANVESKVTTNEGKISALETKVNELENSEVDLSPIQTQIDDLDTRLDELEAEKKTSTIVISTNDISIGNKPSVVEVPYKSNIKSIRTVLSNDSGNALSYLIEKSIDGIAWTSIAGETIPVSTVSTVMSASDALLLSGDLLRLSIMTDNEDVSGLTTNIRIEEFKEDN